MGLLKPPASFSVKQTYREEEDCNNGQDKILHPATAFP